MPKGYDEPIPSSGGGGDFLKLPNDKDSALVVLTDLPMLMLMHRMDPEGDRKFGDRLLCGIPEGLGCPVCENPKEYSETARVTNGVGYYPFWVESITHANGQTESVKKHMVMEGSYSVAKPFKHKRQLAEQDGDRFEGTPYRLTRLGEGRQTTYDFDRKEKVKVTIEDAPEGWDIEKFAIRLLWSDQKKLGYVPEGAGEADPDYDPFEEDGKGMNEDEFRAASLSSSKPKAAPASSTSPAGEEDDGMYGVDPEDPIAVSKVALAMAYEEAKLDSPAKRLAFWKSARMKPPETEEEIDAALPVLETRTKGLKANAAKK